MRSSLCVSGAILAACLCVSMPAGSADTADLVITHARIATVDARHHMAEALAARDGKLLYVGDAAGVEAFAGPDTQRIEAGGRLVLPGLIDSHIHPLGIVQFDTCDLKSQAMSLGALSDFVRACVEKFKPAPGEWLSVDQWNYAGNNQPDAELPTVRAALDRASTTTPIQLRGNDGHHGGFNGAALARATNKQGHQVGLNKATLASDFAHFKPLIGVDAAGEPNGAVDEEARAILGLPKSTRLKNLMSAPHRVFEALHQSGITAMQDASASDDNFTLYDMLLASGQFDLRVNAAQYFAPQDFRGADGKLDTQKAVDIAKARRTKYAGNPLFKAEAVKIFADGVLEGDPNANPPTLPHGAQIRPYLLPRFKRDAQGVLQVAGYLDQNGPACKGVRKFPQAFKSQTAIDVFRKVNGYAPFACTPSRGVLTLPRPELFDWAAGFHQAGFTLHVHAIGDDALRATLDAIERARKLDGVSSQADTIAHAQLIHPDDVVRIGRDRINVAFTYAWAYTDHDYDLSVIPFIDKVTGTGAAGLHDPSFYYERNAYPTRSVKAAGGILIAGSDAPVDTRDPRPFINMQMAVTRRFAGQPALNPSESLSIQDVLDAYTINGARSLGRADEIGSLEVGKSADFILLDQDILALAAAGEADRIGKTRVLGTWFKGKRVYDGEKQ